jgi:hypothetical protein
MNIEWRDPSSGVSATRTTSTMMMKTNLSSDDRLNPWDIAVVGVYFALVLGVGLLVSDTVSYHE